MEVKIFTTLDTGFLSQWQKFWDKSPAANYTNSPNWFLSIIETFGYHDFKILAIYKNNRLSAVAGLIKVRKLGFAVYALPPDDYVCGLPFLLDITNKPLLKKLTAQLLKLGTVTISNLPEPIALAFKKANPGHLSLLPSTVNYLMKLQDSVTGNINLRNKNSKLHQARSLLDHLDFQNVTSQMPDILETVFAIETDSYKQSMGYGAFNTNLVHKFYYSLSRHFADKLNVYIMYHDKKAVAYEIGFNIKSTYYGNQLSTLKSYRPYSLGRVMVVYLVEYLFGHGVKLMDFGSGDDSVTCSFTKESQKLYQAVLSTHKLTRTSIITCLWLKKHLYRRLKSHKSLYSLYRKASQAFRPL